MRLRLIAVGRLRESYALAACEEFQKRIAPYYALDVVEVRPARGIHADAAIREEGERVFRLLQPDDTVWLLDRRGEEMSSEALSLRISGLADDGCRRLTFIVAGTYGAGEPLHRRADFVWSLSKLTLLHEWARMVVLEQLYRSAKIARNEPYHH
jgi:23S rRNA (pseudouridine1915-N3)-methyltransferase